MAGESTSRSERETPAGRFHAFRDGARTSETRHVRRGISFYFPAVSHRLGNPDNCYTGVHSAERRDREARGVESIHPPRQVFRKERNRPGHVLLRPEVSAKSASQSNKSRVRL